MEVCKRIWNYTCFGKRWLDTGVVHIIISRGNTAKAFLCIIHREKGLLKMPVNWMPWGRMPAPILTGRWGEEGGRSPDQLIHCHRSAPSLGAKAPAASKDWARPLLVSWFAKRVAANLEHFRILLRVARPTRRQLSQPEMSCECVSAGLIWLGLLYMSSHLKIPVCLLKNTVHKFLDTYRYLQILTDEAMFLNA